MLLTAVLGMLAMVGGLVALMGLRDSLASTVRQATVVGPALDANRDLQNTMTTAQSSLRGYLVANWSQRSGVASSALDTDDFRRRYAGAESRYSSELQRVDDMLAQADYTDDADARRHLDVARQRQRDAVEAWWAFARSAQPRVDLEPDFIAFGDHLFDAFERANGELLERIVVDRNALRNEMRDTIRRTQREVVGASVVVLLGAWGMGWWTISGLTRPLARLQDTCRRQAAGSRTAWADEHSGAREVRELARGLNALTSAQHELLDEQAYALALAQTTRDLARRIQDAPDVESAFATAVEGVGAALSVDRSLCLVTVLAGGDSGLCVTWSPAAGVAREQVGAEALGTIQDDVRRLWEGERCRVIEDLDAAPDALPLPEDQGCADGAAIVAAFGSGDTPRGVLVLTAAAARPWNHAQAGFVQGIAGDLGRAVEAAEVARARAEHVQRLEELDRQKDGFLSTVSHELRTPLTSINGYLELLEDGEAGALTQEQARMLVVIERNAARLRSLIEDLLLINRMRDGAPADAEFVDVDRLVTHVAEEMAPLARAKGVILDIASKAEMSVAGNRAQLARMLTNLLSNAVKFTPTGRRVLVRTFGAADGGCVRIVCSDEGIGIPAAEQEKLFTRFFRASNATRAEVPGTGLGLVVVKGIVEAHGGHLQLSSTEDVGTTISIELPVAVRAAGRA